MPDDIGTPLDLNRRTALLGLLAACGPFAPGLVARAAEGLGWPAEAPLGAPEAFSFERLKRLARGRARRAYAPPPGPPADLVHAIDFDAFGKVSYRPDATLWGRQGGDDAVRMFPMARGATAPVAISVVQDGRARRVVYSPALFDMPADSPVRRLGDKAGFGGFRVMNADHRTDWIAYLGASYFRSADPFNQYGLSARGLAINSGGPETEEFPTFTAFWIEPDAGGALTVYALLEGPSVAGAYRIVHRRGPAGLVQEITAELTFRRAVARLGLAPLTSMYWYGASDHGPGEDWRPQIHDSDGLSLWTGAGERIWRPLADPPRVSVNAFQDRRPRGFGLMQRDRAFADYQDDGAFYDRRPSAWVEPLGDWGAGAVQLVELPTSGETDDNIVAFWTPAAPVRPRRRLSFAYRLHWCAEEPTPVGAAKVAAMRTGRPGPPGMLHPPAGRRKYVIDFSGGALPGLTRESGVEAVVSLSRGQPFDVAAYPVVGRPLWRLMFDVELPTSGVLDMRAFLRRGGDALTETWIAQAWPG